MKNTNRQPDSGSSASTLNFYCNVINDRPKLPADAPTVGLILCQTRALPARLESVLPTVEEIEAELAPKRRKRP